MTMSKAQADRTGLEVAVIGMAGRFPGARDINQFWENLENKKETVSFFSVKESQEAGVDPEVLQNPNYIKAKGVVKDIEYFDAFFFEYTPVEAEIMNPQLRIFHECAWEALENAGYAPDSYDGSIGLYAGASSTFDWEGFVFLTGKSNTLGQLAVSNLTNKDFFCTIISYRLNLKGPSSIVQSACSTSLVAIHWACRAVLSGECNIALAGGVSVTTPQKAGYLYQEGMIMSPDGHCRPFDAEAGGTITGEGVGLVVLKRLKNAAADSDNILSVIKGSALNNDGKRKVGYTAPSVQGQAEVIRTALAMARVTPESIGYIETHGTATKLGDPVEIQGLKLAFNTDKKGFCAISALKSNVGHMDAAAGVGGFIKAVLALKHRLIPPTLHFEIPNPEIDLINSPFYVAATLTAWENEQYPLRVGVSSFGLGGTNAHVILEEAPGVSESEGQRHSESVRKVLEETGRLAPAPVLTPLSNRQHQLILLSAKTGTALEQMTRNLAAHFKKNPGIDLADAAYTLQVGRRAFPHRWMTVCSSVGEAIAALDSPGQGEAHVIETETGSSSPETLPPTEDRDALRQIGRLWLHGRKIDWGKFYAREQRYRVPLPVYPFEKQYFWIERDAGKGGAEMLINPSRSSSKSDMADWFYYPSWKTAVLNPNPQGNRESAAAYRWLVLVNELKLGKLLVHQLNKDGANVITVTAGSEYRKTGDNAFTLNPREITHYNALFNELGDGNNLPDKIVHLWNVSGTFDDTSTRESFDNLQYYGFFSLLYMAKAIARQEYKHDIGITLLINNLQEVVGDEPLVPGKAPVLGLLKVIPQEYPGLSCRCIDIQLPEPAGEEEEKLLDALMEEFTTRSNDTVIAYRNNRRWVQVFDPLHLEVPQEKPVGLRQNGVYLITGGLGNIGLMFSRLLVKHAGARLVLTGRSRFPTREKWTQWLGHHDNPDPAALKIKTLLELEALGGKVLYFQADAADPEQMRGIIKETEEAFGKINGVIHSAGIIEGKSMRSIQDLSDNDCRVQFQAKVYGLMALEELFKDKDLDFFWMLSSLSCVLGGLGFGAYASANLYMDMVVKKHNQCGGSSARWFSLDWDGMDAEKSINAFERMFGLGKKIDLLVFSNGGNLQTRIDKWIKLASVREKGDSPADKPSTFRPRPSLTNAYVAPRHPTEKAIAAVWSSLLGYNEIGIQDDFLELGGDSLKSITLISRIHQELHVNIPITIFFNKPTIEGIAEYIAGTAEESNYTAIGFAEEKEIYPMSPAQRGLYIIQQLDPNSISYNMTYIMEIATQLDKTRLENAFKKLVQRHESLRTSFQEINGEPFQKIYKHIDFALECFRLEHRGEDFPTREVEQIIGNFVRAFDLSHPPLMRMGIIEIEDKKSMLMVDMHHIISDGVSLQITVEDFMTLYAGEKMPPLALRYKDFSEWQNSKQTRLSIKQQEEFWLKEYAGEIPELILPYDYPRPEVRSFEGDVVWFELDENETTRLKNYALEKDVTLFMFLLAVYNVLLFKLSDQEDIVVGTGTIGRRNEELYQVIGLFINTLPLRNYPASTKNFNRFLQEVKEKTLLAYDNQDYRYEDLTMKVVPNRTSNRNPLYDVVIVIQNVDTVVKDKPSFNLERPGLSLQLYEHSNRISKYDISLICTLIGNRLQVMLEYCTRLFNRDTIDRYVDYFKEIISQILTDDETKLRDITITHHLLTAEADEDQMEIEL
jgi:acyl transferase domain-containing protein/acyl carrier protein